jgi:DNA polymerase III delta subunit
MTLYVFHGDGISLSRKQLQDELTKEKALGHEVNFLAGDKLLPKDLETVLSTSNLFFQETLVIENLLSRLRSKDKDSCIQLLSVYQGDKNIYLWEKKSITKLALGKLGKNTKITESKAPTELFTLLESLEPGNAKTILPLLKSVTDSTEDIIAFTMIARQISYLIMIKSGSSPKFAPWQLGKLKLQAAKWDDKLLEKCLAELLKIDLSIKTGTSKLSYRDHLDIMIVSLLG